MQERKRRNLLYMKWRLAFLTLGNTSPNRISAKPWSQIARPTLASKCLYIPKKDYLSNKWVKHAYDIKSSNIRICET